MSLIALGINHNTASVDLREKLAFVPSEVERALADARNAEVADELAILSTCNRTEIYCYSKTSNDELLNWLSAFKNLDSKHLSESHYCLRDSDAARHMMSVASGLDSLVLGEPQILGQMKSAYTVAKEYGALQSRLHKVFHQVFSIAKKVRSETAIGENPVSVAYAAVTLAQQIFSDLKQDTALLIGAGETVELVARHLFDQGIKKIIVANRTLENASKLASQFNADAILLSDIPSRLHEADIVISSTASQLPLLGKGAVEEALKKRKHKAMFMVDIAVPRDIESQVGDLPDVFLYTVDDLKEVIDENKRSREQAAEIAREIISVGVHGYEKDLRAQESVDTIKLFRQYVQGLQEQECARARKQLRAGGDPEKVIEGLARALGNKFMHEPSAQLKHASSEGRTDLLNGVQTLFNLSSPDPDN